MSLLGKIISFGKVELANRLPWALMAYMLGILACFYFKINTIVGVGIVAINGTLLFITRHRLILSWLFLIFFSFFLGLVNITFRIDFNRHPVLRAPLYQERIIATVLENQPLMDKQILTLGQIQWTSPDLNRPTKIKVHYKKTEPFLRAGDKVKAIVSVYPPNSDFSPTYNRQLWFNQIGGTGVATKMEVMAPTHDSAPLFRARTFINQHLFQILPFSQAEIAAPLMTGEQKLISPATYQVYRRAGIAHVLSVSGFHMALLATFLFFMIRSFCALFPRIALYYNTKKIAAVVAFLGTFLYLGLSGFQIPALRAFVMIALVFLGVLIERPVLSLNSLMVVALLLLLGLPQALFTISFQLSFMAVMVLVVVCQYLNEKAWPRFIKIGIGFIALNILVASALTPFILYHFHQWMPYGVLGNMLFSGVFSFFIMPLLFVGALLIPLGMDAPVFHLAGWGLDIVRSGAGKLAHLPFAEIPVPTFSSLGLGLIAFGLMMLCLMRSPLKWLGNLLILVGGLLGILS